MLEIPIQDLTTGTLLRLLYARGHDKNAIGIVISGLVYEMGYSFNNTYGHYLLCVDAKGNIEVSWYSQYYLTTRAVILGDCL